MSRNPTTNRGEVEATPVPVVLNSESFLGSSQGNRNGPRDLNVGNIRDQQRSEVGLLAQAELTCRKNKETPQSQFGRSSTPKGVHRAATEFKAPLPVIQVQACTHLKRNSNRSHKTARTRRQ